MTRRPILALLSVLLPAALAVAQPFNNTCETAQPAVEQLYEYDMSDGVNVTSSTCDPADVSPPEIWFDYTPAATGTAIVSTCGIAPYVAHLPVSLAAFGACSGPQITCARANCAEGQSEISFAVVQGQHYYIRVASVTSAFAFGGIVFNVRADCSPISGAPANDCCASAPSIGNGSTAFTTVNATRDYFSTHDAFGDNPDVWFNYTAPATGFVKFRPSADTQADLAVAVLDGSCTGKELFCDCDFMSGTGNVRQLVFPTVAGHHYLIRVRSIAQDPDLAFVSGHFTITPATPPGNDDCVNATPITGTGDFPYDNTLANNSGPDDQIVCTSPSHGGRALFQDVWFRWTNTLPAGQDAVISTIETPQIDTKLAVYNNGCTAGVNAGALDCNDYVSDLLPQSRIVFTPTPGATYLIRVGTRPNIENELPPQGRPGIFNISSEPTCIVTAPPGAILENEACGDHTNDDCTSAIDIPCGVTTVYGTAPVIDGVNDQDFFRVTLPVPSHVSVGGTSEFPMAIGIFNDQCENIAVRGRPLGGCDNEDSIGSDLRAGTYYFAVVNTKYDSPCGGKNHYAVVISIDRCEASGQCCIHAGCSVLPHSACIASGGVYGGDDTVCPPRGGNYVASSCTDPIEDISAAGAPGPFCDDCGLIVPLGFSFSFYGQPFTSVHVSSNGFLAFDDNLFDGAVPPDRLPTPDIFAVIAPWWTNLDPTLGGQIYTATLGAAPNRRFVAEWVGVADAALTAQAATFEAILYEGSNKIAFRYGEVDPNALPTIATVSPDSTVVAYFALPDSNSCETLALTPSTSPCCRADFNYDGVLAVQDIFDFLNTWFSGNPRADFNNSGTLQVQDIFDYLNAWFAGCH